jgi:DNA-3-methyladenine glycosylase II
MPEFTVSPQGPFDLAAAQSFAGGFTPGIGGGAVAGPSLILSFPVETTDWSSSAAVEVWQADDGVVHARTDAPEGLVDAIRTQTARSLSLHADGTGWPDVGERDPVIGALQRELGFLRPVCFYSAYEAATSFVMTQRISMRQVANVKERLRVEVGDAPTVGGVPFPAFPRPARLIEVPEIRGISPEKVRRLHGVARATLEGRLDTEHLRSSPREEALASLRELPGVGPWSSEAIYLRGCAVVDELPAQDEMTRAAIADLYEVPDLDDRTWLEITDRWRPYRMWATVLVRTGWSRRRGPASYRQGRRRAE